MLRRYHLFLFFLLLQEFREELLSMKLAVQKEQMSRPQAHLLRQIRLLYFLSFSYFLFSLIPPRKLKKKKKNVEVKRKSKFYRAREENMPGVIMCQNKNKNKNKKLYLEVVPRSIRQTHCVLHQQLTQLKDKDKDKDKGKEMEKDKEKEKKKEEMKQIKRNQITINTHRLLIKRRRNQKEEGQKKERKKKSKICMIYKERLRRNRQRCRDLEKDGVRERKKEIVDFII